MVTGAQALLHHGETGTEPGSRSARVPTSCQLHTSAEPQPSAETASPRGGEPVLRSVGNLGSHTAAPLVMQTQPCDCRVLQGDLAAGQTGEGDTKPR